MPAVLIPERYVSHVAAAGGIPVVLPPASGRMPQVLDLLDALILAGGADIDPARYGEAPHAQTTELRPDRDDAEQSLIEEAMARDLPTLGICRGMQLLAVTHGGRLDQHLPDTVHHERHRPGVGVFGDHDVRLLPGSLAHRTFGTAASVRSYHHQGVADAGSLAVTGWADDDTIEVVEVPGKRFALGVLWHPEAADDPAVFQALVAATN